jgi:hypothetical protein
LAFGRTSGILAYRLQGTAVALQSGKNV